MNIIITFRFISTSFARNFCNKKTQFNKDFKPSKVIKILNGNIFKSYLIK